MRILRYKNFVLIFCIALSTEAYAQFSKHLSFSGEGEIHYNDVVRDELKPTTVGQIDFHKLALKTSYKFDDHWTFVSKFKLEHAFNK